MKESDAEMTDEERAVAVLQAWQRVLMPKGVADVTEQGAYGRGGVVKEQDFRLCEFCGCNTNARMRACCNAGRDADLKKGGGWRSGTTEIRGDGRVLVTMNVSSAYPEADSPSPEKDGLGRAQAAARTFDPLDGLSDATAEEWNRFRNGELRLALVVADILDVLDGDIDIVPRESQLERIRLIVMAQVKAQELAKESARAVLHSDAVTAWRVDARELLVEADPIKRRLARRVIALADALDEEMADKP